MKNKRLFLFTIALIFFCFASVFIFAACNKPHVHEYTSEQTVKADCTTKGLITYACYCGESYTKEITAHHNTKENSGYCSGCGLMEGTEDLEYLLKTDGTYEVVSIGSSQESDIIIGLYNGIEVTSIGESAFYACKDIETVIILDCVTTIENMAFKRCSNLLDLSIGNGVTFIGDAAFADCGSLIEVTIGESVTSLGNQVFYYSNSLTCITVNENNTAYKSIDGNLYTKEGVAV